MRPPLTSPFKDVRRRGIAVLVFALMMVIIIPMIGLAIDCSILFVTKARLQGAVDGAVLAGARALARGSDGSTQTSAAQTAAAAYVRLNFPSGYFMSSNLSVPTPTIDLSTAYQRKITVTATVDSPALFQRFLGLNSTVIKASAQAVRRDVNVMMVVDRSGSLQTSGSCGAVRSAAANFVSYFANARDNVGLITFASSSWRDFPIANTFNSASPNITSIINGVVCAGGTNSGQALWQAYSDLVGLNQPGALNVILFFTDGQPTGTTVDMQIKSTSTCSTKPIIRGHFGQATNGQAFGLLNWSVGAQPISNGDNMPAPNSTNCTYMYGWSYNGYLNNMTNTSDFNYIPDTDIWGNSLDNGYQAVTRTSGHIDPQVDSNALAIALNSADNAAYRIRNGATDSTYGRGLSGVIIFSIGLGNAGVPASPAFLERVSNDRRSATFDSTLAEGLYVEAPTAADLNSAFAVIAAEVLRIAQ